MPFVSFPVTGTTEKSLALSSEIRPIRYLRTLMRVPLNLLFF